MANMGRCRSELISFFLGQLTIFFNLIYPPILSMIKEISAYLQVFRSQKMAALLFLGFASGLPLFLTSRTLQAWMTTEGVDLKSIGLFSYRY